MKLSKNFMLGEFTKSDTAKMLKISNKPSTSDIVNLVRLCDYCLQKIRDHFAKKVVITSGYRSPELNKHISKEKTSQHICGQACDFVVDGEILFKVFQWCYDNLVYDQLIYEETSRQKWIHISYNHYHNRQETLTYDGKKYKKF